MLFQCVITLTAWELERLPELSSTDQLPTAESHYVFVSKADKPFFPPPAVSLPPPQDTFPHAS